MLDEKKKHVRTYFFVSFVSVVSFVLVNRCQHCHCHRDKEELESGEVGEEAAGLRALFMGRQKGEVRFASNALPESRKNEPLAV